MRSNPYRRMQKLGLAHPVVGITISGTEKYIRGWDASEAKKWLDLTLFLYFVKIWVEDPVFVICN